MRLLSGARTTKVNFIDGSPSQVLGDEWLTTNMQNRCLEKRWTGCTIFPLRRDPLPEKERKEASTVSPGPVTPLVSHMFELMFSAPSEDPSLDKTSTDISLLASSSPEAPRKPKVLAEVDRDPEEASEAILRYRTQIALNPKLMQPPCLSL